jgi:hypothetical protein
MTSRGVVLSSVSAAIAAIPTSALASEDGQVWIAGSATIKLNDAWRLSEDMSARFSDDRNGLYQLQSATLLHYRLGKKVTVAGGYVHSPQYSDGDRIALERRAREQVTVDDIGRIGAGKISARLRMEQRWRDNADGTAWRIRPYVKYALPLVGKTSLVLSNETFLNLNTTTFQQQDGLDRMRNLIAINTPLLKNFTAEVGYLNQYGFVRGGEDASDHVASLSLTASF